MLQEELNTLDYVVFRRIINFRVTVTVNSLSLAHVTYLHPWLFSYNHIPHGALFLTNTWPVMLSFTGEWYPSGASVCRGYGAPCHPIHLCKVWRCAGNGLSRSSYWWHHSGFWSYYVSGCAERGYFLCVLQQVSKIQGRHVSQIKGTLYRVLQIYFCWDQIYLGLERFILVQSHSTSIMYIFLLCYNFIHHT